MLRRIIQDSLITGILVVGLVPLVHAGDQEKVRVSRGIVLTIAAIDPKTDTATLKTQYGEEEFLGFYQFTQPLVPLSRLYGEPWDFFGSFAARSL